MIAQYDISNLQRLVSGLNGALIGRGASLGDGAKLIRTETGQLAARIGDSVGPKTIKAGMKWVKKEVATVLSPLPIYSNLEEEQQESSYGGWKWLYAGPGFLAGIKEEDDFTDGSADAAYRIFRENKNRAAHIPPWTEIGRRGHQHIMKLNRVRVSPSNYLYVLKRIQNSLGEMRAAFYTVARAYVPSKRIPGWIEAKMPSAQSRGKTQHRDSGNGAGPYSFTEFIIRSPGLATNETLARRIKGGIEYSRISMANKLKKIVRGYKYNWKTGAVYPANEEAFAE